MFTPTNVFENANLNANLNELELKLQKQIQQIKILHKFNDNPLLKTAIDLLEKLSADIKVSANILDNKDENIANKNNERDNYSSGMKF